MRSLKVLFFGVLLPGTLSAGVYAALAQDGSATGEVRVMNAVEVEVEGVAEAVEAAVAAELDGVRHQRCEHTRREVVRLGTAGVDRLAVHAGSGALRVVGRAELAEVVVRSTMCASSEGLLERLRTELSQDGDQAVVRTEFPRSRGFGDRYARIDLEVDVPLGMAADLEDSSGQIYVGGTGETRISDGSGGIEVWGLTGSLTVRDGSGGIEARDIGGDVDVVDGSGEVRLTGVSGTVTLTDGSGSIDVSEVSGSVHVRADGSGSIRVADVGGDFIVRADGSGAISHRGVDGRVDVPGKRRR